MKTSNLKLNLAKVTKRLTGNATLGKQKHSDAEICPLTFARLPNDEFFK